MSERFLGIDTSNYTTSAALVEPGMVLENRKKLLPVKPGEKGLRQSDAVFHHVRQLPEVLSPILEALTEPPKAIGVSLYPTTEKDSYMPCFLVGKNIAQLLGKAWNIPVEGFSHQQGHIAAALYSAGKLDLLENPFLAFHVSGGTTEALFVKPDMDGMPQVTPAARSLDLKAGQAVDRVGVMLGLSFPCGPELEKLALRWEGKLSYRPVLKGSDCSLSGIENQCRALFDRGEPPIAFEILDRNRLPAFGVECAQHKVRAAGGRQVRMRRQGGRLRALYAARARALRARGSGHFRRGKSLRGFARKGDNSRQARFGAKPRARRGEGAGFRLRRDSRRVFLCGGGGVFGARIGARESSGRPHKARHGNGARGDMARTRRRGDPEDSGARRNKGGRHIFAPLERGRGRGIYARPVRHLPPDGLAFRSLGNARAPAQQRGPAVRQSRASV